MTRHHLDAWSAHAEIVAIFDPSEAARVGRASDYGISCTYADAAWMLARKRWSLSTSPRRAKFHAGHVRLAAARGLAILCQKPLAPSFAEAWALVAEVDGIIPLMVHENWRFRPH